MDDQQILLGGRGWCRVIGIADSTSGHDVLELPRALNEARPAMDAARRLGTTEACFYDELAWCGC